MRDHAVGGAAHAGSTPQPAAAARISMSRAAAPPSRTYWFDSRMPRLPPVEKFPRHACARGFRRGSGIRS